MIAEIIVTFFTDTSERGIPRYCDNMVYVRVIQKQLKIGYIEFARLEYYADAIHSAIVNPAG